MISKDSYRALQNKFRGNVSAYKSRKFVKNPSIGQSEKFSIGLRDLFLDARWSLSPSRFDEFLSWVNSQLETRFKEFLSRKIGYEELSGVNTRAPVVTLERELIWITARIKANHSKINFFRSMVGEIEGQVYSSNIEKAIDLVKNIEQTFGVSLWSVQLRIALEHHAGGLERQKRYSAEVRRVFRRGLLGFIAYYTSVRNEERSSFSKYCDDVNTRINSHRYYETFVKTYVRFRLTNELPPSELGLADILRVEQSHSSIDIYETFVTIAQEIVRREDLVDIRNVLGTCLDNLSHIKDYRLEKMGYLIKDRQPCSALSYRSTSVSSALLSSDIKLAARNAHRSLRNSTRIDPWNYIYAGITFAHFKGKKIDPLLAPSDIPWLISRVINQHKASGDCFAQLRKMVINLSGLPTSAGIIDFLPLIYRKRPDQAWRPWLICMNSQTYGVEDTTPDTYQSFKRDKFYNGLKLDLVEEVWGAVHGQSIRCSDVSLDAVELFTSVGMLSKGEYRLAIETLTSRQLEDKTNSLRSLVVSLLLHAYFGFGERQSVIELIADVGSRCSANNQLLPVLSTLENYVWTDYKAVISPLSASIALHLLWTENESDLTASYLRYATGKAIKASGVGLPSNFINIADMYPKHQLIYFLRFVCIPKILDVSRVLKCSQEVLEERQAICSALRSIDTINSDTYQEEIMAISNQLALDEGHRIVDSTRVHVDIIALSKWAAKEFSDDYSRYLDLLNMDLDEKQNFDDVLKELASGTSSRGNVFKPETEADALLGSILSRYGEEFLTNPSFGLDFYLSKRIRHQSFIGFIRGPLEFANLITTRESELGGYHRNVFWLDKFTNLSLVEVENLADAFLRFSEKFDDILIKAKDTKFHLFTKERPTGLLYLDFTILFPFAKAMVSMDFTIKEFNKSVIAILWAALEPSLAEVRQFVAEELKTKITAMFDELRANVRKIAGHDNTSLKLDVEIGNCSTEIQRSLDEVATWFSHADLEAHKRNFSLKQIVSIAIDYVLKCQRAFEPEIDCQIDQDFEMPSSNLVFVHDTLFIALDNIKIHSGLKKPKVVIIVNANLDNATLSIEVLSEYKVQNKEKHESSLREIRQLIDDGKVGRRTRIEGKSGILKLAAVVQQTSKGRVQFGFVDDEWYRLKVTYSLVMLDSGLSGENDG